MQMFSSLDCFCTPPPNNGGTEGGIAGYVIENEETSAPENVFSMWK